MANLTLSVVVKVCTCGHMLFVHDGGNGCFGQMQCHKQDDPTCLTLFHPHLHKCDCTGFQETDATHREVVE